MLGKQFFSSHWFDFRAFLTILALFLVFLTAFFLFLRFLGTTIGFASGTTF